MVEQYLSLLSASRRGELVALFGGRPNLDDPRMGAIAAPEEFAQFFAATDHWLTERRSRVEQVALTRTPDREVAESILHLEQDGEEIVLPVAVVGDIRDGTLSEARVYHSLWPLLGRHQLRPAILNEDRGLVIPDVVGRYQRALAAGDLDAVQAAYEDDGYAREPSGGTWVYRGKEGLRRLYGGQFSNGGGVGLEYCSLTDDGVRCAIEYNVVSWGVTKMTPQAGVAVYERGASGRLAAARIYDDVEPPL